MSSQMDAIRAGRSDSLQRRPAVASATGPAGQGGGNREYLDRRGLGNAARIKMGRIEADPGQPRKTFPPEALARLADNMRVRGQLVPILVRWCPDLDKYRVIDGERRFRAAQLAGLIDMACVVEDEADPDAILELQLIANALREDVAPVEQARAWDRLMKSQGLTMRGLADKLGYDHSTIGKSLDLLKLDPEIQEQVDAGQLAASTATQIARLDDPAEQRAAAAAAVAEGLSRAEVAARVDAAKPRSPGKAKAKPKGRAKVPTSRRFRRPGGLVIEASRAKGLDLSMLAAELRAVAAEIEGEVGQETPTG